MHGYSGSCSGQTRASLLWNRGIGINSGGDPDADVGVFWGSIGGDEGDGGMKAGAASGEASFSRRLGVG